MTAFDTNTIAETPSAPLAEPNSSAAADRPILHFFGTEERGAQVLLFLSSLTLTAAEAENHFAVFSEKFRVAVLRSPLPSMREVLTAAAGIEEQLAQVGTKRTTAIGIAEGTPLAQALAALYPDTVRRLVLVDATARVSPSLTVRIIDRIERFLPLGLPLRPLTEDFDSRPLLHRIRCPALVLSSPEASGYVRDQSAAIAAKIPNARKEILEKSVFDSAGRIQASLAERLLLFLQVAAKRPQKNLSQASADL